MTTSNQVELKVWTWQGMSLGAKHFYASLSLGYDEKSVKYILTPKRAKELEFPYWERCTHDIGLKSDQFDTEREAVEYAKSHWLEYFDADELVFCGNIIAKKGEPCITK